MREPIFLRLSASKAQVVEGLVVSEIDYGYFVSFDMGDGRFLVDGSCTSRSCVALLTAAKRSSPSSDREGEGGERLERRAAHRLRHAHWRRRLIR